MRQRGRQGGRQRDRQGCGQRCQPWEGDGCLQGGSQLNLGVAVAWLGRVSQSFAPSVLNSSVNPVASSDVVLHETRVAAQGLFPGLPWVCVRLSCPCLHSAAREAGAALAPPVAAGLGRDSHLIFHSNEQRSGCLGASST